MRDPYIIAFFMLLAFIITVTATTIFKALFSGSLQRWLELNQVRKQLRDRRRGETIRRLYSDWEG